MLATPARLDFGAIPRPAFGRAAQHLSAAPTPARARAAARHRHAARTAAELLPELPAPGESVHALMTGHFDLCQVITAVVDRHRRRRPPPGLPAPENRDPVLLEAERGRPPRPARRPPRAAPHPARVGV